MAIKFYKWIYKFLIAFLSSVIYFYAANAYAEYYLVYSGCDSGCLSCVRPTDITPRGCHPCDRVRHVELREHEHHGYACHHRAKVKSSCHITVNYSGTPTPSCGGCNSCVTVHPACGCPTTVVESHRFVDFSSRPYHGCDESADMCDGYANYDPDLATGDDDQVRYPDMDIDE